MAKYFKERRVPVGIIGLGTMGKRHAHGYLKDARAELVGGLVRRPESVAAASGILGVPVTTDWDEFLARKPRLVSVCTPTATHADFCRRLLSEGIAVLCEKPLARTLAEAESLVTLVQHQGGFLQVAHCMTHDPVVEVFWQARRAGVLGDVTSVSLIRQGPSGSANTLVSTTRHEPAWFFEQLVHLVSVLHALADAPFSPGTPGANGVTVHSLDCRPGYEAIDVALTFDNAITGHLTVTPDGGPQQLLQAVVEGTQGAVRLQFGATPSLTVLRPSEKIYPVQRGNIFDLQVKAALRDLLAKEPPVEDAQRGLWAMRDAATLLSSVWSLPAE